MDDIASSAGRLFTEAPSIYLSWPAVAMVAGTLLAILSPRTAAQLSVVPRTGDGLLGIVTAPFIHLNFSHLAANLPPFLVLGYLVLRHDEKQFLETSLAIALLQGALLWVFGRKAAHAGMSGVIFGFFGYLLSLAWFVGNATDLFIAGGVLIFYGGMIAGVAPARSGISWEGHLFGALAGVAVAWFRFQAP